MAAAPGGAVMPAWGLSVAKASLAAVTSLVRRAITLKTIKLPFYLCPMKNSSLIQAQDQGDLVCCFLPACRVVLVECVTELLSGGLKLLSKRKAMKHHLLTRIKV